MSYLDWLKRASPNAYIDLKPEAQQTYNEDIQQKLQTTVWASGCQSWYQNAEGRNTTLWPGLTVTYRRATRWVNPAEYTLLQPSRVEAIGRLDILISIASRTATGAAICHKWKKQEQTEIFHTDIFERKFY